MYEVYRTEYYSLVYFCPIKAKLGLVQRIATEMAFGNNKQQITSNMRAEVCPNTFSFIPREAYSQNHPEIHTHVENDGVEQTYPAGLPVNFGVLHKSRFKFNRVHKKNTYILNRCLAGCCCKRMRRHSHFTSVGCGNFMRCGWL